MTPDVEYPDEEALIAEGLASVAITFLAMGESTDAVRQRLIAQWEGFGQPPGAFARSAAAASTLPQPLVETAEESERLREIREHLGVTSAETYLTASLTAREVLERLAADFD